MITPQSTNLGEEETILIRATVDIFTLSLCLQSVYLKVENNNSGYCVYKQNNNSKRSDGFCYSFLLVLIYFTSPS